MPTPCPPYTTANRDLVLQHHWFQSYWFKPHWVLLYLFHANWFQHYFFQPYLFSPRDWKSWRHIFFAFFVCVFLPVLCFCANFVCNSFQTHNFVCDMVFKAFFNSVHPFWCLPYWFQPHWFYLYWFHPYCFQKYWFQPYWFQAYWLQPHVSAPNCLWSFLVTYPTPVVSTHRDSIASKNIYHIWKTNGSYVILYRHSSIFYKLIWHEILLYRACVPCKSMSMLWRICLYEWRGACVLGCFILTLFQNKFWPNPLHQDLSYDGILASRPEAWLVKKICFICMQSQNFKKTSYWNSKQFPEHVSFLW